MLKKERDLWFHWKNAIWYFEKEQKEIKRRLKKNEICDVYFFSRNEENRNKKEKEKEKEETIMEEGTK